MRVRMEDGLLKDSSNWDQLDAILALFLEERHIWQIDDPEVVETSDWHQSDKEGRAGRRILETLKKCYTVTIYPDQTRHMHACCVAITAVPKSPNEIAFKDALKWLSTPLQVIVENGTNDGNFLRAMMVAFGREPLRKALNLGFWQIGHAGGIGEIIKRLDALLHQSPYPPRAYVMTDSDGKAPGQLAADATRVQDFCKATGISFHVLRKRTIENYIPKPVLNNLATSTEKADRLAALELLTPSQWDHIHLKEGYLKDLRGGAFDDPQQAALLSGVPKALIDRLKRGFGDSATDLFRTHRDQFTQAHVEARCRSSGESEISSMFDEIERLL
jgi:hypothetical protein